ncbi:hypothetical protein Y032_0340g2985 [Ancylostoma ceylanicum]|nr:hypothetical protein Y032_0340g2985 [Ancylostoma ceylanicum]
MESAPSRGFRLVLSLNDYSLQNAALNFRPWSCTRTKAVSEKRIATSTASHKMLATRGYKLVALVRVLTQFQFHNLLYLASASARTNRHCSIAQCINNADAKQSHGDMLNELVPTSGLFADTAFLGVIFTLSVHLFLVSTVVVVLIYLFLVYDNKCLLLIVLY